MPIEDHGDHEARGTTLPVYDEPEQYRSKASTALDIPEKPHYESSSNSSKGDKKKQKEAEAGEENEDEKKVKTPALPPVPAHKMFRFASTRDTILMVTAVLAAVIGGCSMPIMIVLFGDVTNAFVQNEMNTTIICGPYPDCCTLEEIDPSLPDCTLTEEDIGNFFSPTDFFTQIKIFGGGCALIGLVNFCVSYTFVTCLNHAAECQVFKIRGLFLKAVLRQDIGWYDTHQTGDFASRMTEDLNKLQEGIGEKIGMFVFFFSTFLASIINAFIHGWELTLVIMAAMPVLMIATGIIAKSQTSLTEKELAAYSKAGSIADEVISSIRTVVAFGGQKKEVDRFEGHLVNARKAGIMRSLLTAIGGGLMWFIIYASYALAFWYGVKLIMDDREKCDPNDLPNCNVRYDAASLLIVFFSVLMGAMNIGQAVPYVEAFSMARGAAAMIYMVIDRTPEIDSSSEEGKKPAKGAGRIHFDNVWFNYPSRKDVRVLQGLTLSVEKGETVALVGPSGCGKSTVIQLLQRFYDPDSGSVRLEGDDIRTLHIGALRDGIGIVGQEPVLFGCTIAENIRYGRDNVTDEEIEEACKQANAYSFIQKLPKKYNTLVGERGAQLSGGQKQRIAIARALVKNPSILLLDEATSALDTQSESVVQIALDKARSGRTTIVVAHRLSTIRTADKIVAIKDGCVAEIGVHDDLMQMRGLYYSLVTAQVNDDEKDEADDIVAELDSGDYKAPSALRRKRSGAERTVSISSVRSDDSSLFEDALEAASHVVGSAGGALARGGSTRDSKRRKAFGTQESVVDEKEDLPKPDTVRIFKTNSPEWPYLVVGALGAVVMGASIPIYAILFGEVLGILSEEVEQDARDSSVFYAIMFLLVGVVCGTAMFLQMFMFSVAGEHLTQRMRRIAFQAMLTQEIAWFDLPENSTGALCARLSSDAAAIQGATGNRLGTILQSTFTLVISISLAIYYQWKLGLVASSFIPLVLAAIYFQTKIIMGHDTVEKEAFADSAKLAVDAITNIRTVAGLRREKTFVARYIEELRAPHNAAKKKAHLRGVIFGFAQSIPFFAYSACIYYGGYLVKEEGLPYEDVFKVTEAIIFGTMMVGQATAFAPNYNKAVIASARIFKLLDRKPLIDSNGSAGLKINNIHGNVDFKDANFRYPSRRQVKVLRDLNLSVSSGQKIALVGPSGCGKSTCIQLLQRFYDLESGQLNLEGQNIESLNVPLVRSKLGIVSQEPVLFDRTLADNIKYGDNDRTVSMDEVVEAARKSNIHNFIDSLPLGYDTMVGEKGTQLSGGQKQRVAIARALVRNPTILLLDEATSALDTESEAVVQEALDKAQEGRTSITIAHRLSTVQNVDRIYVISSGRIVESGTHAQLVTLGGVYAKLWGSQSGSAKKNE